jgi:hypothetical protein
MVKFRCINEKIEENTFRNTKLKKLVDTNMKVVDTVFTEPKDFKELIFLGNDKSYGDTFLGIKQNDEIWILFGEKGDEF